MADSVEKWGDNIESAVELALKELKAARDEVVVTVLEEPSKGFLGLFGSKLARVKVERKPQEVKKEAVREAVKEEPVIVQEKKAAPAVKEEASEGKSFSRSNGYEGRNRRYNNNAPLPKLSTKFTLTEEDTDAVPAQDEPAVIFVQEIAKKMNLDVQADAALQDTTLYINLSGNEVGSLIGKRGQTLDSIQYLASIVQNKGGEKHIRVLINAENYREKREKTLQQLAKRLSEKCVRLGKNVRLEPMNPYERKVIHATLQGNPRVTTRSEGIEPNRRVIIEYIRK